MGVTAWCKQIKLRLHSAAVSEETLSVTSIQLPTLPWQCWKIKDLHCPRSLVFPRSTWILPANQRQICVQTARFSLELSDWLTLSPDTLCGCGCGWACACDCHRKISLSCDSKSSLTASYFCLIVSNLSIKLACATATDKSSLSRPELLWHFTVGKAKTKSLAMLRPTAQYSASFAWF